MWAGFQASPQRAPGCQALPQAPRPQHAPLPSPAWGPEMVRELVSAQNSRTHGVFKFITNGDSFGLRIIQHIFTHSPPHSRPQDASFLNACNPQGGEGAQQAAAGCVAVG